MSDDRYEEQFENWWLNNRFLIGRAPESFDAEKFFSDGADLLRRVAEGAQQQPPPLCTGSGTPMTDFSPVMADIPSTGRCGICNQVVPVFMHDFTTCPHPYQDKSYECSNCGEDGYIAGLESDLAAARERERRLREAGKALVAHLGRHDLDCQYTTEPLCPFLEQFRAALAETGHEGVGNASDEAASTRQDLRGLHDSQSRDRSGVRLPGSPPTETGPGA